MLSQVHRESPVGHEERCIFLSLDVKPNLEIGSSFNAMAKKQSDLQLKTSCFFLELANDLSGMPAAIGAVLRINFMCQ